MSLLIPKAILKKRYFHKLSYEGVAKGNIELNWGQFGLRSEEGNWISNRQIEAARKVISRYVKNYGKCKINIFPHLPKTKKPLEVRMGSGKGSTESYVAVVKKNTIMFEIRLTDIKHSESAKEALRQAAYKLPIKCTVVY